MAHHHPRFREERVSAADDDTPPAGADEETPPPTAEVPSDEETTTVGSDEETTYDGSLETADDSGEETTEIPVGHVVAPDGVVMDADPFGDDDPMGDETGVFDTATFSAADAGADDEFDALGFDTSFGAMPGGFGLSPGSELNDNDDTPPGGIYVSGGEDLAVLDAHAIGRALAEARGEETDFKLPDMGPLQVGLVGIDIGAAKAVVARFDEDGRHEIVPNEDDDLSTPMQVFFDEDGEQLVGREARAMAPSAPARAVVDLKEKMLEPEAHWTAGEDTVEVSEVLAILFKRLVGYVTDHAGQVPTHLALAAPAWFGDSQKEMLKQAAGTTGLTLVGITDEALAAAVPYSLRLNDLKPRKAMVFDLGHAALGVAIVRCAAGDIEIMAQDADTNLGSAKWDELIANESARKFKEKHGQDPWEDPAAAVDLRLRAEDAKRSLSQRAQCTMVVNCGGKTLKVGFKRSGFEKAARKLIQASKAMMTEVLAEAGLIAWDEIDAVILTGGGSRTPSLRRMVIETTGRKPERGIPPEEGVAIGALYWGIGERHRTS
jgi:actin-like ATPase involved in cell morphogenesis